MSKRKYFKDKQDEHHRTDESEDEEERGCIHKTAGRSIYKIKKIIFDPTGRHLYSSRKKYLGKVHHQMRRISRTTY